MNSRLKIPIVSCTFGASSTLDILGILFVCSGVLRSSSFEEPFSILIWVILIGLSDQFSDWIESKCLHRPCIRSRLENERWKNFYVYRTAKMMLYFILNLNWLLFQNSFASTYMCLLSLSKSENFCDILYALVSPEVLTGSNVKNKSFTSFSRHYHLVFPIK